MRVVTVGLWVIGIWSLALPAYAYLDPGTGSVLLQGLLAGIAGGMAILKLYWRRFKAFFLRGKAKESLEQIKNNETRDDRAS